MSIPLDRLYHYIESVAQDIYGDTVIYRFYPHGSKNLEDLNSLNYINWPIASLFPHIYCNDQEPLNYDYYQTYNIDNIKKDPSAILRFSESKKNGGKQGSQRQARDSESTVVFGATKEDL